MPPVTWGESYWGVRVGYDPDHTIIGFGNINETPLDGCSGPASGVVTVHDPVYEKTMAISGFAGEMVDGERIFFNVNPQLHARMSRAEASWITDIFSEGRRIFVTYWVCGTGPAYYVDQVIAE